MSIRTVSIIGLGALGILFGRHLSDRMPPGGLRVIADRDRIRRYEQEHIYCNGEPCHFHMVSPEAAAEPADLVIFAVKYNDLPDAIEAMKNQVGERTIILSLLNGISSEAMIGRVFGMDNIVYCVAQGMDAVKAGNKMTYENMGMLCIGEQEPGEVSSKVRLVADFLEQMEIPYEVDTDMKKRMWGKLMLNVGVNQTVAVYESDYGGIQREGPARDTMIAAMREVIELSAKEGISLTEEDLSYWLKILSRLNPEGKPSMRQDLEAGRYSEVELFAGTVLGLGQKHGVPTPVNQALYEKIKLIESRF
ncbi:MAG: ketopantoate reductase family protein [Syntrophomonadaceae bacterium]|nr:ketopantoate reductase family protein [Syntrophomonadaceae bacterium]